MPRILRHEDYTIAWICALQIECQAAVALLDAIHEGAFPRKHGDDNNYIAGSMNGHNIIILSLPRKSTGTVSAATACSQMKSSFPNIQHGLMVGIAAGVPGRPVPPSEILMPDIRLGDVVVATPDDNYPGILGYELGKLEDGLETDRFRITNRLNQTDRALQTAFETIQTQEAEAAEQAVAVGKNSSFSAPDPRGFRRYLSKIVGQPRFQYPGQAKDKLYHSDGSHTQVQRPNRESNSPIVFYGLIASGNKLVRSARFRDTLRDEHDILAFEMEAAGIMNIMPVAVIRGVCDYADAYKNDEWHGYAAATAASYARGLLDVLRPVTYQNAFLHYDPKEIKMREQFIHTLNERPYSEIWEFNVSKSVEGTLEWFFHETQFLEWKSSNTSELLWIRGSPGQGKSVLSKFILQHLEEYVEEQSNSSDHKVVYFFHYSQDEQFRTISSMLCALIVQLMDHPFSFRHIPVIFQDQPGDLRSTSFATLWSIAKKLLLSSYDCIYFVIDALDECEPGHDRETFIKAICQVLTQSTSSSKIKVLITSRPAEKDIEVGLRSFPIFNLRAAEKDLQLYIKSRSESIGMDISTSLQRYIATELVQKAGTTFLWVSLVVRELLRIDLPTKSKVCETIKRAPRDLVRLLERITEQLLRREDTCKMLLWVVYARRPLRLNELEVALSIDLEQNPQKKIDIDDHRPTLTADVITRLAGTLLEVNTKDGSVYLIHQAVKDYFELHDPLTRAKVPVLSKLKIPDLYLGAICMSYLSFRDFENLQSKVFATKKDRENYRTKFELLDYTSNYWYFHIGTDSLASPVLGLLERFLAPATKESPFWIAFNYYSRSATVDSVTGIAIFFDIEWLVHLWLSETSKALAVEFSPSNIIECAHRSPKVLKLLLDVHGTSWNEFITENVWRAAAKNSTNGDEVIKILLEQQAVTARITESVAIAATANYAKGKKILTLFLNQGADFQISEAVLKAAVANEESGEEITTLLLDRKGPEVHITKDIIQTAAWNCINGKEIMIILLRRRAADMEITSEIVYEIARRCGVNEMKLLFQLRGREIVATGILPTAVSEFDEESKRWFEAYAFNTYSVELDLVGFKLISAHTTPYIHIARPRDRNPTCLFKNEMVDVIDPSYSLPCRKEFKFMRVFEMVWDQSEGDDKIFETKEVYVRKFDQPVSVVIRRLVIIKVEIGHCLCLPIFTYDHQEITKRGVITIYHGMIYTGKLAPDLVPYETPLKFNPIRMIPHHKTDSLHPASRINYAKIYAIEHNVKIVFIGMIDESHHERVARQYNQTVQIASP